MNSEVFPGSVPLTRTAGLFLFPNGPYLPGADYAFYLGFAPDVTVTKHVRPVGNLLPGQPLTYTLSFSNSGIITAAHVTLTDTLPALLTGVSITSSLDPGVAITQTGSASHLAWSISDLAPGQGGKVFIHAMVNSQLNADAVITNVVAITTTGEITLANNKDSLDSAIVVPRVHFSPTTYAVFEGAGMTFVTVTLDIANPFALVTVTVTSTDNSAIAGSDYTAISQTLTISPGLTSAVLGFPIHNDTVVEPDESFTVTLSSPVGAALGAATSASVLIRNDDTTSSFHLFLPAIEQD